MFNESTEVESLIPSRNRPTLRLPLCTLSSTPLETLRRRRNYQRWFPMPSKTVTMPSKTSRAVFTPHGVALPTTPVSNLDRRREEGTETTAHDKPHMTAVHNTNISTANRTSDPRPSLSNSFQIKVGVASPAAG